jgi:hypothetical protein
MSLRNDIVTEFERRMWSIKVANGYSWDVMDVRRNPKEPNVVFPCVNIFEMEDPIILHESTLRGPLLVEYHRTLNLTIEFYVEEPVSDAGGALAEAFAGMVRYAVFMTAGVRDDSLGGLNPSVMVDEKRASHVIRPPFVKGKSIIGRGIDFVVDYFDDRTYSQTG